MNRTQSDNMIRQQQGMPPLGQMPLNTSHFLQNQQQPGQQQQPSARMNLVPNSNSNPAAMLGNPQPNSANNSQISAAQYQLSLQRRQQLYFQQSQNAQMNGSPNTSAAPHMGASPHNAMGFPGTMIQQGNGGQLRRVASHPQSLNQTAGHVGGMHPGQQGVATLSMGMNPQTSLPAHLRQAQQQQQQHQQMGVRMPQMQGPISPDIPMAIGRQPNPGMPQNPTRTSTSSAQLMASLVQPSGLVQAQSGGGQPPLSLPQSGFQHPIPHQTSSLSSSSPRPGNHPQNLNPAGMSMATSGSSQGSGPRAPLNSDNVMFMNFHNPPYSQTHGRMQQGGPQFAFNPSSGSPSQQIDIPQSINGPPLNSSNPPNRSNFQPTPAQQYEHMQQTESFNSHYNMPPPPPTNVPPRPPSHPNPHPNPHHSNPPPRQQQPHQHSPHQSDHMVNHIPQPPRPQSQPQAPGRPSSQAGPSHTPRSTQAQLTPGSGHLSQARIPPAPQPHQSPHQPPHPAQQLSIAPRPAPPPVPAATPSSSAPSTMASSDGGPSTASRQQQQNL